MSFINLRLDAITRQLIEAYHNASSEGGSGWIMSPSGKKINIADEAGLKRATVEVSVPATLFLRRKDSTRTSWTVRLEEMFFSKGTNTDGKEYTDSPKVNGQAKTSANGISVYGFNDGSFLDGYYCMAIEVARKCGLSINEILSEDEISYAINRGYINDKGEVLNPPEKRNTVRKDLTDRPRKGRVSKEEFNKELEDISSLL